MVWIANCKDCNEPTKGWDTYHKEGTAIWVAYCYECDYQDPFTIDEKHMTHWTLRLRCRHWLDDWTQCKKTWQICRDKGSSQHVKCFNWWGGGRVAAIGGSAQHTPNKFWRRSCLC